MLQNYDVAMNETQHVARTFLLPISIQIRPDSYYSTQER